MTKVTDIGGLMHRIIIAGKSLHIDLKDYFDKPLQSLP